jgi:ABC-type lipoprotein export system ATPase subunit
MSRLGIEKLAKKKPAQISGGQQQRVAIARALVSDADIIWLMSQQVHLTKKLVKTCWGFLAK